MLKKFFLEKFFQQCQDVMRMAHGSGNNSGKVSPGG
jgi:hypothetical protein